MTTTISSDNFSSQTVNFIAINKNRFIQAAIKE